VTRKTERVLTNLTCDQNCTYCNSRSAVEDPAIVRSAATRIAASAAEEIVLSGGEPTMRRDLPALVRAAKGRRVVLETNATLVTPTLATALKQAGLAVARVNLSSPLDDVTRDPGGVERTIAGIHALLGAQIPVELQVAIVPETVPHLARLPEIVPAGVRAVIAVAPVGALTANEAAAAILTLDAAFPTVRVGRPAPPPCAFPRPAWHLFSLTRGGADDPGHERIAACAGCLVADRCPGVPLGTAPFDARPVTDERTRRRLTIIDDVAAQQERELVSHDRHRLPDGGFVDEAVIRVVFHCNQACRMCFVSTHLPAASNDRVRAEIDRWAAAGRRIILSGGEPTLHPELPALVAEAARKSAQPVGIQTNAIRIDGALAERLKKAGLADAFVSLHGARTETSDRVTGAPGTFAKTLAGIEQLVAAGIDVVVNFVMSADNRGELPGVARLVADRGARLNVSFVAAMNDLVPGEIVPRYSDVLPEIAEAATITPLVGLESMCGLPLCLVPQPIAARLADAPAELDRGEFAKPPPCARCAAQDRCWGVRRSYLALHGDGELRPYP
jgi:MoaA/NifB/PqqE/SkfB family radical SAM enzyme